MEFAELATAGFVITLEVTLNTIEAPADWAAVKSWESVMTWPAILHWGEAWSMPVRVVSVQDPAVRVYSEGIVTMIWVSAAAPWVNVSRKR